MDTLFGWWYFLVFLIILSVLHTVAYGQCIIIK